MSDAVPPSDAVPLVDLRAAHAEVAEAIEAGLRRVIADTAFVLGPDVAAFEAEFAASCGVRRCIGVSNGTDALELALRALEIGPGDEVVLPANTFIATALGVMRAGATPVLADCDPEHLLLDPASVAQRLSSRTRALLPVHLFGQTAPMEALQRVLDAGGRPIDIVEDMAQAQGARRNGRSAGSLGRVAATSFYPGKNLGAYGDAGAVVTDDEQLAEKLVALRNYGSPKKYQHPEPGFNCRLDTLQAAVLRAKLPKLADWNARRRAAAERYDAWLASADDLRPVRTLSGNEHIFHIYAVRVRTEDGSEHDGVASLGVRPMFDPPVELLEAHLFDFDADLYGQSIEVMLHHYLRPEAKFADVDALLRQMAKDAEQARKLLKP